MTLHSSSSNVKVSKLLVIYLEKFSLLTDVTLTSKVVLVADMRRALQLWNTSWSSKRQSIWVCPSRCGGEWYYKIQRYTWLGCPQYFSRTKWAVIVYTWWRYNQTELTNKIFPYWETVNTSYCIATTIRSRDVTVTHGSEFARYTGAMVSQIRRGSKTTSRSLLDSLASTLVRLCKEKNQ